MEVNGSKGGVRADGREGKMEKGEGGRNRIKGPGG
jgi:hypothetical protein